jgi:hypothetical protein
MLELEDVRCDANSAIYTNIRMLQVNKQAQYPENLL